jgi:hypothetical protein
MIGRTWRICWSHGKWHFKEKLESEKSLEIDEYEVPLSVIMLYMHRSPLNWYQSEPNN